MRSVSGVRQTEAFGETVSRLPLCRVTDQQLMLLCDAYCDYLARVPKCACAAPVYRNCAACVAPVQCLLLSLELYKPSPVASRCVALPRLCRPP